MISSLFFILFVLFAVPPLLNNMTIIESEDPAICSLPDILLSFNNPSVTLKEYLCHSA